MILVSTIERQVSWVDSFVGVVNHQCDQPCNHLKIGYVTLNTHVTLNTINGSLASGVSGAQMPNILLQANVNIHSNLWDK